jgi:hypothetical protein
MLAQNFQSPIELGLTDLQFEALCKTLVLLETGKLKKEDVAAETEEVIKEKEFTGHFNMDTWTSTYHCGTVACIGGTAELIGKVEFMKSSTYNDQLYTLFYPPSDLDYSEITVSQAANALRNYLSTGNAKWDEVLDER